MCKLYFWYGGALSSETVFDAVAALINFIFTCILGGNSFNFTEAAN